MARLVRAPDLTEAAGLPGDGFVTTTVRQRLLDEVAAALAGIPEVLQVQGVSGQSDLMVRVVRSDADDLYRVLAVERTATALVMREVVDYRIMPLLERRAEH